MMMRALVVSARERLQAAACILRRIIGVPDYDRYLAHVHAHHPDAVPMSQDEFVRQRMLDKYTKPGGRCC